MNKRASVAELAPPQSLTDRAYAEIEELIVTLRLAPGAPLSEAELSARLDIGRTPIREALQRIDRDFNVLCSSAAHNEFAAGAMGLMHSLSRRFWYLHYKQAADMPLTAKLHADIARAIAAGDAERAAKASERLLDAIERFTRSTVGP